MHALCDLVDIVQELGFPQQSVVNDFIVLNNTPGRRLTYVKAMELFNKKANIKRKKA